MAGQDEGAKNRLPPTTIATNAIDYLPQKNLLRFLSGALDYYYSVAYLTILFSVDPNRIVRWAKKKHRGRLPGKQNDPETSGALFLCGLLIGSCSYWHIRFAGKDPV
jgi:hypothetical protein